MSCFMLLLFLLYLALSYVMSLFSRLRIICGFGEIRENRHLSLRAPSAGALTY